MIAYKLLLLQVLVQNLMMMKRIVYFQKAFVEKIH